MLRRPHRLAIAVLSCSVLWLAVPSVVSALEQTLAKDILADPLGYQNAVAKVVGEVVKVEPDLVKPGAGMYTMLDSSDTPIRVHADRNLPRTGEQLYVVGLVYQDDPRSKPYIDELRKGPAGPPLKLLIGAGGILALLAFILVYLLIWHRPALEKTDKPASQGQRKPVVTQVFEDDPVAVLSAVSGPHKGKTFNIYHGVTTIGREDDRTIPLSDDQTISRQQARIFAEDSTISLVNESSTNPTRVGSESVEKCELMDGDIIQMGATKLKLTLFDQ